MSSHDAPEKPMTEWTMAEIAPSGKWVYLPGDENGMLAVNPDSVIEDMVQGYVEFWTPYTAGLVDSDNMRREVELTAGWQSLFNHRIPNDFQLVNNIYHDLNTGRQFSGSELEALVLHPYGNGELRHIISQQYILDPMLFGKIWVLDDKDPSIGASMRSFQRMLMDKKGVSDTRFGKWYAAHMRRILDGDESHEPTDEERAAALGIIVVSVAQAPTATDAIEVTEVKSEELVVRDKTQPIPHDLLYPGAGDPRFLEKRLGLDVFIDEEVKLKTNEQLGVDVDFSSRYVYSHDLEKQFEPEDIERASERAAKHAGSTETPEYFELLLTFLFNSSVRLTHIISGLNKETGEQFHAYGYRSSF